MNILLINPWIYDFKAYDLWLKPLGLLYAADFLKKSGYDINFIDCTDRNHISLKSKTESDLYGTGKYYHEEIEKPHLYKDIPRKYKRYGISLEAFKEELRSISAPEVILVTSVMTYWYKGAFEVIKIAKEAFPGVPVVLGGIYASLCYDHAKEFSGTDYVIKKFNFKEFSELIAKLTGHTHDINIVKDIVPAYYLYPELEYACILTSRGCPFRCSYCASSFLYDKFCQRDYNEVINEVESYYKRGIKNIAFYDDALFFNKENHIIKILEGVIKKGLDINFHTPNGLHARYIDKELAYLLKKSGFKTMRLSLETQNPALQKETGGKVTNNDLEEAVNNLLSAGFSAKDIGVYVMTGLPGQTYEEIIKTVEFVKTFKIKVKLTQFSPIPHTLMGDKMLSDNADPLLHNNTYRMYKSPHISFEDLQKITDLAK
ncbi:MAG: radical SAM protein [Armatimonadota bacterium]